MKKLLSLIAVSFSFAGVAQALPVTYEYTATIDLINSYNPSDLQSQVSWVDAADILGHSMTKDIHVTGRFTYDTDTPHTQRAHVQEIPGQFQVYDGGEFNSLSASFNNGLSLRAVEDSDNPWAPKMMIFVNNNYLNYDGFNIQGSTSDTSGRHDLALHFWDYSQTAFNSAELNPALDFGSFMFNQFSYTYTSADMQSRFGVLGTLTSLTAVPEPASALLMLSGLGLLAAARRSKASGGK
jgi:hypothetical protein